LDLWNQWFAYAAWLQIIDSRDFGRKIFEMRILQGRKTKADPLFTQPASWPGTPVRGRQKENNCKSDKLRQKQKAAQSAASIAKPSSSILAN
jgi:hypothetical protein